MQVAAALPVRHREAVIVPFEPFVVGKGRKECVAQRLLCQIILREGLDGVAQRAR
jgi:hypothetical protein